jgi:hypothetical protein
MGAPGPPTALTDETFDALVTATRAGAYRVHAAGYAGVHEDTLRRWLRLGAAEAPLRDDYVDDLSWRKAFDHHERCARLREALREAEAKFALSNLTIIENAARTSWQAAAWLNERRFKDLYALRHEVTGKDGEPVQVEHHTIEQMLADPEKAEKMADASIEMVTSTNGKPTD